MRYWLFKSEPDEFSFDMLRARPEQTGPWDGVRNYQARNNLRAAKLGDLILFYHSSVAEPHVVGIARVAREAYDDPTALDPDSHYFDPKSSADKPRWSAVDVQAVKPLGELVTRTAIKGNPALAAMQVIQKGYGLSIQPVRDEEFEEILRMGKTTLTPAERATG